MLVWIFGLGVLLRLYKAFHIECIAKDGLAYIHTASLLWKKLQFHPTWSPFYPFLLGLMGKFVNSPESSGIIVSLLSGVLLLFINYKYIYKLFGEGCAIFSTAIIAVHPYLVRYSAEVLSDMLFTLILVFFLWYGCLLLQNPFLTGFARLGILGGLIYLTKPEGIGLIFIYSMWIIIVQKRWSDIWKSLLALWVFAGIFILPYIIGIRFLTGEWLISLKSKVVFSNELVREGFYVRGLVGPLDFLLQDPPGFLKKVSISFTRLLVRLPEAFTPVVFILFIIGILRLKKERWVWYILSYMILYIIGYSIFHPGRRYLVNWVIPCLPLAYYGMGTIRKNHTIYVSVLIFLFLPMFLLSLRPERRGSGKWREIGYWIRNNIPENVPLWVEDPRIGFYAKRSVVDKIGKGVYIITDEFKDEYKLIKLFKNGVKIYYAE